MKQEIIDIEELAQDSHNFNKGDDIAAAVKGATLSWTTEAETDQNTVSDDDNNQGGNQGGGTTGGELEG